MMRPALQGRAAARRSTTTAHAPAVAGALLVPGVLAFAAALTFAAALAITPARAAGTWFDAPARAPAFAAIQAGQTAPDSRSAAPAPIRASLPAARLAGEGTLRWFGLRIYDARLWVGPRGLDPERIGDDAFALEISYARSLSGAAIAERSAAEIARLGLAATEGQRIDWLERMAAIFPDVRDGDRIAGVFDPRAGTRFFLNERPIGSVADPAFARAFFGIWLDARTAAPQLREALLGATAHARGPGQSPGLQ